MSVALHAAFGLDVTQEHVRAMPWGALLARIEWLYTTDPLIRHVIDDYLNSRN